MCHGAVTVGGLSVRLQRPEVHLRGEVRHRGHPKAAESQNQYNDSNDEVTDKFAVKDAVKHAVKVNTGDTVKNAIVSSVFVRLRTCFGEQYLSDVVVEESGQSAVIEASPLEFRRRFWSISGRRIASSCYTYIVTIFATITVVFI